MDFTHLIELAKQGDADAIGTLLSHALQMQRQDIQVDWQGGQLNLRLMADQIPNKTQWLVALQQQLQTLSLDSVSTLRVFAYQPHNPTPLWSQSLSLSPAASSPPPRRSFSPSGTLRSLDILDRFLVCGLGSLGQYCVLNLKRFEMENETVQITAIDKMKVEDWEVRDLPSLLIEAPIIGDCRDDQVLLRAGIMQCRAILIVTSNESVNVETAIAARRLNSRIRIVMRSSRHNLNQLLKQQLGDFIAFEPAELPAPSFALAGLQEGILGFFSIGDCRLQVVEQVVSPQDYRFDGFPAMTLHKRGYRLLSYIPAESTQTPKRAFHHWGTETILKAGDTIAFVEVIGHTPTESVLESLAQENVWQRIQQELQDIWQRGWQQNLQQFGQWLQAQRVRQMVAIGFSLALLLWLVGTVLLKTTLNLPWQQAISTTFILLLGGYGDVFGGLEPLAVPGGVQFLCGLISLTSIASVLGVLGLITDNLLSSRFEFLRKRPAIPKQNHVVVVGFGRIGQRVATILREFKQPVVVITEHLESTRMVTKIPLVVGDLITELLKVNLASAKSVVVVTDDQMLNLEVALVARNAARQVDRTIGLVIRTYDQRFRDNLSNLLPDVKALAAYELSAEAFVGAAFGENILGLLRLNEQTILVTEYQVTETDTLVGKSLFQISYGYGVVPIFHQRANQFDEEFTEFILPPNERQLHGGDRLVVLSSLNGLRRIEHGDLLPPRRWRLEAQKPLNPAFLLYCGNDLARISGCGLDAARNFMNNLPGTIQLDLYDYQAHQLTQELSRQLPIRLVPLS
jgi:Trk K+ transport system NAD-binding subunit